MSFKVLYKNAYLQKETLKTRLWEKYWLSEPEGLAP